MPAREPDPSDSFVPAFSRSLVHVEQRLMILSTCLSCGESRMVSSDDDSIEEWESRHRCRKAGQARHRTL